MSIEKDTSSVVVPFPRANLQDVSAVLRAIADEIDSGAYGEIGTMGIAILGDRFECFSAGEESTGPAVCVLFQAAIQRMSRFTERHGRHDAQEIG